MQTAAMKSHGVRADHVGDRRLLALRHRFEKDRARVARRDHVDAGGARAAQHDAAAADVGVAGVAELHDVEAGGDIGRAVLAVLQMHRQRAEIGVLALQHHLLHRRVGGRDLHRLVRIGEPLGDRRQQARLVGVERQRQPLARAHDVADQFGLLRPDRLEPGRARIAVEHARRRRSRSIGWSWTSHSPSCTSRSTKRRRRNRSVSGSHAASLDCNESVRPVDCASTASRRTMPCRGRKRNTRSATSMSGCCGAAPARRCCSCTAPTACRSGCRCSTCCPSSSRCSCPSIPGFGTSDNPAVDAQHRRSGDVLPRFPRRVRAARGPCRRPVARRLGRGGSRGAQLLADQDAVAARARRHPHQGHAERRQLHLGPRGRRSATSTTTRPSPIRSWRCSRPTSRPTSC